MSVVDFDAIVVGGGPAGLTAARDLAKAGRSVLVLDKESLGGRPVNIEWIEDYPKPGEKIAGPKLAAQLVGEAETAGAQTALAEVVEIESYSSCLAVSCDDGNAFTASVVIVAAGLRDKALGVASEERLAGKGVIHCAFCDAGLYAGRDVAVAGGGDAGLIEAMLLADRGAKVRVVEARAELSARPELQERAREVPNLEILCGKRVVDIAGEEGVNGLVVEDAASGVSETLETYGVLLHVGVEPATDCVEALLDTDDDGFAETSADLASEVSGLILAGDVRRNSPRTVTAAVEDGVRAAATALAFLAS